MSTQNNKRLTDGDGSSLSSGIVKRSIIDAREEAHRIIAEATAEAEAIRQRIDTLARETKQSAYDAGYEEGLAQLTSHLLEAHERRDTALASAEHDLLRLAVKIAEKLIGREIERDETALADIVAAALRHARRNESLRIRVNPADLPVIQKHRDRLEPTGRARFLDLVPDPNVKHGGCIIESDSGTIDAQLETQLRVIERDLLMHKSAERH
jgi:type III secretion protein L